MSTCLCQLVYLTIYKITSFPHGCVGRGIQRIGQPFVWKGLKSIIHKQPTQKVILRLPPISNAIGKLLQSHVNVIFHR